MRSAFTQLKTPQSSRHPVQTPAEISEARLRTGMDLKAPYAPTSQFRWTGCGLIRCTCISPSQPSFDRSAGYVLHQFPRRGPPFPVGRDGLASWFRFGPSIVDQPPVVTPTTTVAIETTMPPHLAHPCHGQGCCRLALSTKFCD